MSKSIIIQKNGVAQTLALDKLRLPKHGGGTEDWLPADGKNLVKIVVKQNGTYKASDFGAYGISEVKVACTLSGGSATSAVATKAIKALHNPCPAEGGLARVMSAHHLETLLSTTGSCQWVPEAEVSLGTKYINVDNKTYKAADDGKYGYSQVTVSGISITKDGDTITHTDGTGTKTYKLPHHIRVEHPPLKIAYVDGETIDFFDMLVKAYNADGTVWTDADHPGGVIPLEELILPVTVADISQVSGIATSPLVPGGVMYTAGKTLVQYGVSDADYPQYVVEADYATAVFAQSPVALDGRLKMACVGPSAGTAEHSEIWDESGTKHNTTGQGSQAYTYQEKTAYYDWWNVPAGPYRTSSPINYIDADSAAIAWTILYGVRGEGGQHIPVQWARPWDGEVLDDGFTIQVRDTGFGGAEGGGGQTSGGGAGRG